MEQDAIVIGAGIAGLVAATRLQQHGHRTLLVERQEAPGGLCRTVDLGGRPFVIGCNDFGAGLFRLLERLGAPVASQPARTRFHFAGGAVQLPPDLATLGRLLPLLPDLWRLWRAAARAPDGLLCATAARVAHRPQTVDLLRVLPYALGAPDMPLAALGELRDPALDYGYDKTAIPVGGPGAITAALAARFAALGGTLRLHTAAIALPRPDPAQPFQVRLHNPDRADEICTARQVLSSQPRADAYPPNLPTGLACASVHLAVRSTFPWPHGIHAVGWMPGSVSAWLTALDRGEAPDAFGFHLFRSLLPEVDGAYSLTGFFFLPRGQEQPGEAAQAQHLRNLERGLAACLPGLWAQVTAREILYPRAYRQRVGCDSRPAHLQLPPGLEKPPSLDPRTGLHHIGTSVQPAGDHAAAAALSGWRAADAVHTLLSAEANP